ncbi:MAG TPA: lysylphosphatidylglycerol synthase transmembrane domain-containing protein [Bacteroidales bacterium]|nr:lysylphosphatidylglycerol synthase transmembrane domain-containing protein [Bacteroidales bacterium]
MTEKLPGNSDGDDYGMIRRLKPVKILLPVLIGLGVVLWFILKDVNLDSLKEITFTWESAFWLFVAILFVLIRTFGYMARIRSITGNNISWLQSLRIILLWEFTSAITPSTVGGTAFAVIFLNKEGISAGKSASAILLTSFLDELYFIIMFPLLLILIDWKSIFITSFQSAGTEIMNNLVVVAFIGYAIILAWVLFVGYGLFIRPQAIKKSLIFIVRIPFLRKWHNSAVKAGDDIVNASDELKDQSFSFWWSASFYTFISWTARYLTVNAILLAFFKVSDHLLIFARQLVLWIMMIVSPTPGGAGFAELILGRYISDLIPVDQVHAQGISIAMALIWRVISYYPFLLAGIIILPAWVSSKFIHKRTGK